MVSILEAESFHSILKSGRNSPLVVSCGNDDQETQEHIVKFRTNSSNENVCLICELIASLLAKDLELPVPDFSLVKVDKGFANSIPDEDAKKLAHQSLGLNFGSTYLGIGSSTWPIDQQIPASMQSIAAEIYAFDILIQNPDRMSNNPNLLRRGNEIFIIDHEVAFNSVMFPIIGEPAFPWEGQQLLMKKHIFFLSLKGSGKINFSRIESSFKSLDNKHFEGYSEVIPDEWKKGNDTTDKIIEYLKALKENIDAALMSIKGVLA